MNIAQRINIDPQITVPAGQPTPAPITIDGPLKLPGVVGDPKLSDLIGVILAFIIPLAGIILFLVISWGGIDILFSQGNSEKVQSGQQKITAGVIGFILLVLSFFFTRLIGQMLGLGGGIL